jgi:hypothetical protein
MKKAKKEQVANRGGGAQSSAQRWLCTQCGGDAMLAYSAKKNHDWDGRVKIGERLCTKCFVARGGPKVF